MSATLQYIFANISGKKRQIDLTSVMLPGVWIDYQGKKSEKRIKIRRKHSISVMVSGRLRSSFRARHRASNP
jgi:hypothetical protein